MGKNERMRKRLASRPSSINVFSIICRTYSSEGLPPVKSWYPCLAGGVASSMELAVVTDHGEKLTLLDRGYTTVWLDDALDSSEKMSASCMKYEGDLYRGSGI